LCLNEIRKAVALTAHFPEVHFWRTTSGAEVDFVIETEKQLIPIEVKFSESYGPADFKNLLKFKATYPEKVDKMILLYNGPFKYNEKVIYLPFWFI